MSKKKNQQSTEVFDVSPIWSKPGPKYDWPRNTVSDDEDYVLHGKLENLPKSPSKVVRIFMSSTFTDTTVERNLLMKNVYPRLKKRCKEVYDLDFQVVDMRWGVRNEASIDHSTGTVCMQEIEKCKEVSIGPTFVALLSHRYGGRGLPTSIPNNEMTSILGALNSESQLELINKWYRLDTNAVPPEYSLLPIVEYDDMENYLNEQDFRVNKYRQSLSTLDYVEDLLEDTPEIAKEKEESRARFAEIVNKGTNMWKQEEPMLAKTIRHAVEICKQNKSIDEENSMKYFRSITEEEIRRGIIEEANRNDRCLVFVRKIENIDTNHKKAWRFIDMEDDKLDENAQLLLKRLIDMMPQYLKAENRFQFTTTWSKNDGINETDNAEYLQEFCETFEKSIWNSIENGVKQNSKSSIDEVYTEVLEHGQNCVEKVQRFYGRDKDLEYIKAYLLSNSDQPLVIYGESGCGKTSLLAKAATKIKDWVGSGKDVCTILRFLGTTLDSSSDTKALLSITRQLLKATRLENMFSILPSKYREVTEIFQEILKNIPRNNKIIIIADSLDQLSGKANDVNWLPVKLPSNVKVIISSLEEHGVYKAIAMKGFEDKQKLKIESLDMGTSQNILALWLKKINRDVSVEQREKLKKLLKQYKLIPLYVRLVFGEISKWKSFNTPQFDCPTVPSCLQRLFRRLETKHGHVLVCNALGYLSASKNGLTELEMEDLLSLDDEVLSDVYQYHVPPTRRLPSILWSRIRADLEEYIVDRGVDGTKVMAWYHRQFIKESRKRYIPEKSYTKYVFQRPIVTTKNFRLYKTLVEYFSQEWVDGKKKPFKYTEFQYQKLKLTSSDSSADRYVSQQPTIFNSQDGSINLEKIRYNKRKLSELPSASLKLFANENNTAFIAKHIVLDPEFLMSWLATGDLEDIYLLLGDVGIKNKYMDELDEIEYNFFYFAKEETGPWKNSPYKEVIKGTQGIAFQIAAIHECLKMSYTNYVQNPTFVGADISGKMLQVDNAFEEITRWIRNTDGSAKQLCALVPTCQLYQIPGSELKYSIKLHKDPILSYSNPGECYEDNMASISKNKLIAIKPVDSHAVIDCTVTDIPDNDRFEKVTCKSTRLCTKYVVSLKKSSVIYISNRDGQLVQNIHLAKYLPSQFHVSDLKIGEMEGKSDCFIIITDLVHSNVFALMKVDSTDPVCTLVTSGDGICHEISEDTVKPCRVESTIITSNNELLVLKSCGYMELYDVNMSFVQRKLVQWPKPSERVQAKCFSRIEHIALGFPNGQFTMVKWYEYKTSLKTFKPKFLFADEQMKDNKAPYGIPHHMHLCTKHELMLVIILACTSTHLIGFTDPSTLYGDEYHEREDKNEEKKTDLLFTTNGNLKMLFRIKRRYDSAVASWDTKFILAARRGYIDVFKTEIYHKPDVASCSLQYHSSIDTYGQLVTHLFPCFDRRVQAVMATCDHQIMNYYLLDKLGRQKKYLPTFDKSNGDIKEVLSFDDMVITFSSRGLHQWNVCTGKIIRNFKHPKPKHHFLKCATDEKLAHVVALDIEGQVLVWKGLCESQDFADNVAPKHHITKAIIDVKNNTLDDIFLLVVPNENIILASRKHESAFQLKSLANMKEKKLPVKGPFQNALKIDEENILFITRDDCIIFNIASEKLDKFPLKDILKQERSITDVKYEKKYGTIIFVTHTNITFWNPKDSTKDTTSCSTGEIIPQGKVYTADNEFCSIVGQESKTYAVINLYSQSLSNVQQIQSESPIELYTVTSDGHYLVYVCKEKELYLRRISDGMLRASYTMYTKIQTLSVSNNSWYVLVGTSDNRLVSFIIADSDVQEHDERIKHVRKRNRHLSEDDAVAALGTMTGINFDVIDIQEEHVEDEKPADDYSDDENLDEFMKQKKKFVKERSKTKHTFVNIVHSDESSGEENIFDEDTEMSGLEAKVNINNNPESNVSPSDNPEPNITRSDEPKSNNDPVDDPEIQESESHVNPSRKEGSADKESLISTKGTIDGDTKSNPVPDKLDTDFNKEPADDPENLPTSSKQLDIFTIAMAKVHVNRARKSKSCAIL